jgi:ankyrin repeat protein
MSGGTTPLFAASSEGHLDIVTALITADADVNKAKANGVTPLLTASYSGQLEIVTALAGAGADASAPIPPNFPMPPLYMAAQHDLLEFFSLLPRELAHPRCDPAVVLAALQKCKRAKERGERRHEMLVCVSQARAEQDAGRGDEVEELLGRIAKLPPEVVREFVVPYQP